MQYRKPLKRENPELGLLNEFFGTEWKQETWKYETVMECMFQLDSTMQRLPQSLWRLFDCWENELSFTDDHYERIIKYLLSPYEHVNTFQYSDFRKLICGLKGVYPVDPIITEEYFICEIGSYGLRMFNPDLGVMTDEKEISIIITPNNFPKVVEYFDCMFPKSAGGSGPTSEFKTYKIYEFLTYLTQDSNILVYFMNYSLFIESSSLKEIEKVINSKLSIPLKFKSSRLLEYDICNAVQVYDALRLIFNDRVLLLKSSLSLPNEIISIIESYENQYEILDAQTYIPKTSKKQRSICIIS